MPGLVNLALAVDPDPAGVSAAETVNELVLDVCLKLIQIDAAKLFMTPQFRLVLDPEFKDICSATPLVFTDCLRETLCSKSPPTVDYFLNLPDPIRDYWTVYVVVLVDLEDNYSIYIGSATGVLGGGCVLRAAHYRDKTNGVLPAFVRRAYDEGSELVHIGILCWCPIPRPALVPRVRLLFLALEAVFTCLFFACRRQVSDSAWAHLFPWKRAMVSWRPLCTHLSLIEGSRELELTSEQLEEAAAMRVVKMAANSKAAYEREREKDLEAHLLRKRTEKAAFVEKNPEKHAGWHEKSVAKIKATRKHYCTVCDHAFASSTMLEKHLESKKHLDQVALNAGVPPKPPSANALRSRAHVAKAKASMKFYCTPCGVNPPSKAKHEIHIQTKRHKKKVAALEAAVSSL